MNCSHHKWINWDLPSLPTPERTTWQENTSYQPLELNLPITLNILDLPHCHRLGLTIKPRPQMTVHWVLNDRTLKNDFYRIYVTLLYKCNSQMCSLGRTEVAIPLCLWTCHISILYWRTFSLAVTYLYVSSIKKKQKLLRGTPEYLKRKWTQQYFLFHF